MNRGIVLMVLIATSLTGCAIHRARVAHRAETSMVGYSEAQLLDCAGAPAREKTAGDKEYLTYLGGGDGQAVGFGYSNGLALGAVKHRYCEATFTVEKGKVVAVDYRGRTGGLLTRDEQCGFIVDGCVR